MSDKGRSKICAPCAKPNGLGAPSPYAPSSHLSLPFGRLCAKPNACHAPYVPKNFLILRGRHAVMHAALLHISPFASLFNITKSNRFLSSRKSSKTIYIFHSDAFI